MINFQEASQLAVKRAQESGTPLTGKESAADIYKLAGIDQPRTPRFQTDGSPLDEMIMGAETKVTPEKQEDIREQVRGRFQGAIDAIMGSFAGQLAAEEERGRERVGETRAATSYFGTMGAPTGRAEAEKTAQYGKQQIADIQARRDLAIQNVFLQIEDRADKLIAAEKKEALGAKEAKIDYLIGERDASRQNVKDLAKQGVSLDEIEERFPNDVQNIITQTGWSPAELDLVWNANKKQEERIEWDSVKTDTGVLLYGTDPTTGELKQHEIPFDVPSGYKFEKILDSGQMLFLPASGEIASAEDILIYGGEGEFAKPEKAPTAPSSYREWSYAGGEKGTGKTYAEWLDSEGGGEDLTAMEYDFQEGARKIIMAEQISPEASGEQYGKLLDMMLGEYPTLTRSVADKMLMDSVNKLKKQVPETIQEVEENISSDFMLTDVEALAGKTEEDKKREAARKKAIEKGETGFLDPTTGEFIKV